MLFYYGTDLLQSLESYYLERLSKAIDKGFQEQQSRYYWLYDELSQRAKTIRQALLLIHALPPFMIGQDSASIFEQVMNYISDLFSEEQYGISKLADSFYCNDVCYWQQLQEALDSLKPKYRGNDLPLMYVELSECIVRAVRMYLYIREHAIKAIDREKFDCLMGLGCH